MSCLIKNLMNPHLATPLPGLKFCQDQFQVIPQLFSCCQGDGLIYEQSHNSYTRCALSRRLTAVNKLYRQFQLTWGEVEPASQIKGSEAMEAFTQWLLGSEGLQQGYAFNSKSGLMAPSQELWLMAFMTAWRTGRDVHVISLRKKSSRFKLIPSQDFAISQTGVVFLELKDSLFHPQLNVDFDAIVNWCERSLQPLWIDFSESQAHKQTASQEANRFKIEHVLEKRLNKLKNKPPLQWMGPQCTSRIQQVCLNWEAFL